MKFFVEAIKPPTFFGKGKRIFLDVKRFENNVICNVQLKVGVEDSTFFHRGRKKGTVSP
jgi:hypothetical protein